MADIEVPEAEGAIRDWLRAQPSLASLVGERVVFKPPESERPTLPLVAQRCQSNVVDDVGFVHMWLTFDCWGSNKHAASQVATILTAVLVNYQYKPLVEVNGQKLLAIYDIRGGRELPGETGPKRYRVDAQFMVQSA